MKCWAIFVLVVVWARGGEAVRCRDAASCAQGMMGANMDDDKAAACRATRRAVQCLREAVEDCRRTQSVPEQALNAMDNQMSHIEDIYSQNCQDSHGEKHEGHMSRGVSDVRSSVIVIFVVLLLAAIFP